MWKSPICASSAIRAKSVEIASSKPPATAYPSTTAIVGLLIVWMRSYVLADSSASFNEAVLVPTNSSRSMLRSAPAQNVLPRPRNSTTRTSGSSAASSTRSAIWVRSAQLTQFLTSGRFSQMVATWSFTSYWMGSLATAASAVAITRSSRRLELNSYHTRTSLEAKARGAGREVVRHALVVADLAGVHERAEMRTVVAARLAQDDLDAVDDRSSEDVVRPPVHVTGLGERAQLLGPPEELAAALIGLRREQDRVPEVGGDELERGEGVRPVQRLEVAVEEAGHRRRSISS